MSSAAEAEVARIERAARLRIDTPCAEGTMPFRIWGDGPTLLLCHGGAGSFSHWIRNIEALAAHYRVIAPDLPGLGDAASLPEPYSPESSAAIVDAGLDRVLARNEPLHLCAFSWGCTQVTQIARRRPTQVKSMLLVGPASLGEYPRPAMPPLRKRSRSMSEAELREVARYNLLQLMIHREESVDDLAIHLQWINTNRARLNSPQFARGTTVIDAIAGTTMPLQVLMGEYDAPAYPHLELRRQRLLAVRADLEWVVVPDVGHWTQYEWPGFNDHLLGWLARHA